MTRLRIVSVNYGSFPSEKGIVERLRQLDGASAELTPRRLKIEADGGGAFDYALQDYEEDLLTVSYAGRLEDGSMFRIVRPSELSRGIIEQKGGKAYFTIASMNPSGYAVRYEFHENGGKGSRKWYDFLRR